MNAPFLPPMAPPETEVKLPAVWEPFNVQTDYVDGASLIRVLPDGLGHVHLWRYHLSTDGDVERVLAARLVMPRQTMREVALAMLTAAMVGDQAAHELRRKMD